MWWHLHGIVGTLIVTTSVVQGTFFKIISLPSIFKRSLFFFFRYSCEIVLTKMMILFNDVVYKDMLQKVCN